MNLFNLILIKCVIQWVPFLKRAQPTLGTLLGGAALEHLSRGENFLRSFRCDEHGWSSWQQPHGVRRWLMADCSRVLEKLSFGRALVVNDAPFRSGGDVWTVAFVEAVGHDDDGKCVLLRCAVYAGQMDGGALVG